MLELQQLDELCIIHFQKPLEKSDCQHIKNLYQQGLLGHMGVIIVFIMDNIYVKNGT